jgi:hypothetical protein
LNDFNNLELKRKSRKVALEEMALHRAHYDGRVLEALYAQFGTPAAAVTGNASLYTCSVEDLREGMLLTQNILTRSGRPVLMAGLKLGAAHLLLLRDVVDILDIQEPVQVSNK